MGTIAYAYQLELALEASGNTNYHVVHQGTSSTGLSISTGETFARGNEGWGRPRNPAFLLEPDELFHACRRAGLVVLAFEQGATTEPGPAVIQRVVAIRPPFDPLAWPVG